MCALIKRFGDISESLLACSVPDVQGDWGSLHLNSFDFEVDSYGAEIIGLKGVFAISHQNACFSDSAIPNNQILERDILLSHYYLQQVTEYL